MSQVVLLEPIAAGKASIAPLLAKRTGRRNVPLYLVRWADRAEEIRRVRDHGPLGRFACWKPFEAHAVERALTDFPDAIIDFGAGH